jgi:cytochrome c-type biogenesis protein CcmH/NrfG
LMTDGHFADAATILESLRQRIGAHDVAISINLAWCYLKTDRVDDAIATAAQAYRLAPANPRVSHSYGWILYKSGRNSRGALALLQQASAQAPDWALARQHLAEAEMVHGRASVG